MERIVFEDGQIFQQVVGSAAPIAAIRGTRPWQKITVSGVYDDIEAAFRSGMNYKKEWDSQKTEFVYNETTGEQLYNEDGSPKTVIVDTVEEQNLSDYCVFGEIIGKGDGVFWVVMGKKTDLELTQEVLDQAILDSLGGI